MKQPAQFFIRYRYRQVYKRLQKFHTRFQKALQESELHQFKLAKMQKCLLKYQRKLATLNTQLKLAGTVLALGLTLMAQKADAQQRTPAFGTFSYNPFGLTDVGSNSDPTFADLDGDGDLDAFVGGYDGNIHFFENTGDANNPTFATASENPFGFTNIGEKASPSFADLDGDGDLDAFVGGEDANVHFFENTGDARNPTFATVSVNPFGLESFTLSYAPTFVDLDGDGDLDAFIGRGTGDVFYFENIGDANNPTFASIEVGPFGLEGVNSYSNPAFADLDGDGDLDALIGEDGVGCKYFENTGDANNPAFATASINPFGITTVLSNAAPSLVDLDGDGDMDAFIGESTGNIRYHENTGTFTQHAFKSSVTNPFGLIDIGDLSTSPSFVDIDSDGDLDVFVVDRIVTGAITYFENTGNNTNPAFGAEVENPFGISSGNAGFSPANFADLDGDGDLDAFLMQNNGDMRYFENTGNNTNPTFATVVTNPFGITNTGSSSHLTLTDIDGDGDLDAFISRFSDDIFYFENTGNNTNPTFATAVTNPFGLTSGSSSSTPTFADLDGDGDLDGFASFGTTVNYFENTGNNTNPTFATVATNPFGLSHSGEFGNSPSFVDLDGDGDLDAFLGANAGNFDYFKAVTPPVVWNGTWSNATGPAATDNAKLSADYDVATNGNITALDLTIDAGQTLSMGSGSITVAGCFDNNGNAFSQTGGTFTFNGSDAQYIMGANSFDDLVINNAAGVTLEDATDVTGILSLMSGALTSEGNLTLKSTGTGASNTAIIDFSGTGSIAGNLTLERFMDGNTQSGYRYISTGVAEQTIGDINDDVTLNQLGTIFSPGTDINNYNPSLDAPYPNIFYYDQSLVQSGTISVGEYMGQSFDQASLGWEIPNSTATAFDTGNGVALNITSDVTLDFTGTLQTSNVVLSLVHGGQSHSGWHLIGNPFAATLDWDAVYEDGDNTGVEPTAYVFNADGQFSGAYATYNAATDASVNGGIKEIASGQGFFVRTSSGQTGDVTIKTSHTSSTDVAFSRTTRDVPDWEGELRLTLTDEQQGIDDELLIYFVEDASDEKDFGDARKFFGEAFGLPELASKAFDADLLMDCRAPLGEETQTYQLTLKSGKAGQYTLQATTISQFGTAIEVYLEDRLEDKLIDLNQQAAYVFDIEQSGQFVENRFYVHIRDNRITSLNPESLEANVRVFAANQQVYIQFEPEFTASSIAIYDLTGRQIFQKNHESDLAVQIPVQASGIYVIRIENKRGSLTQKIMIQ